MAAIYRPPRYMLETDDYLTLFQSLGHHFIIGEDFNAKHIYWGSRLIRTNDNHLYKAIKLAECECLEKQFIDQHTYIKFTCNTQHQNT